ncbi:unnamed protein product [Effrenium voratum]|uniref:Uncharacterized protein n=1 Tax=Effrenium voratum TaxID=2562239 RepID=A0AA36MNC9_9DINO|nr:unnamed protein product [Effrenium voratum]
MRSEELQQLLARSWKGTDRPRSSLGSVRMEDFSGDRGKYRNWRRAVLAQQQLYRLESAELAMMIYLSCKGDAREVLDQITIEEMVAAGGLAKLWQLLNEAYGESSDEYFERIEAEFNQYRRQPGQSIASYLGQIKKLKAQYLREDEGTILSDRAWAQRLLVRASLSRRERLDVFYSAGGAYNSKMIESALRHRASRVHEDERRTPALGSDFRKFPFARPSSSRSTSASTRASTAPSVASSFRSKGAGKGHHRVHLADDGPEDEDMEDLEGDEEAYETYLQGLEEEPEDLEDIPEETEDPELDGQYNSEDEVTADQLRERDGRQRMALISGQGQLLAARRKVTGAKVKSGQDKPFQPKNRAEQGVHLVQSIKDIPVLSDGKNLVAKEVNFTFMAARTPKPKEPPAKKRAATHCFHCGEQVQEIHKFCPFCGTSQAAVDMRDVGEDPKRGWSLVDYESDSDQDPSTSFAMSGILYPSPRGEEEDDRAGDILARHQNWSESLTGAAGSQDPVPPSGELPAAVKKKRLEAFREQLYNEQAQGGRFQPSEMSPTPSQAQKKCGHPFHKLRWTANGSGHYARCGVCDLKSVVYWSSRPTVLVAGNAEAKHQVLTMDYLPKTVLAIADSGCRTSVGGIHWHSRFQQELIKLGLEWEVIAEEEYFKFGAGAPEKSGMLLTDTRHPGLDLLQFPNILMGTKDRELAELRQQLVNALQTYAFVTAAGEEEDLGTGDESSGNTSETESEEHELRKLLSDMESLEVPTRDYIQVSESEDDSYKGAFDGGESTTSHELGVEWPDSDSSTEVEERSYDEGEAYKGPVKAFAKGQKRKVKSGIRQLKQIHTLDKVRGNLKRSEPVTYKPRVPKRPYKVLEIFTWTLTVTMLAAQSGWIGLEPIALPHWDLRLPQERKAALNYVRAADPDLTVIAWPCTVWSQLQGLNVKTVEHAEALADRQMMDRDDFLSFVHDVAKDRRACGKAVVGENPLTSRDQGGFAVNGCTL